LNDRDSVDSMKDLVRRFCEERDWDQFHTPKDLAIGIATEAGELLEIFRFMRPEQQSALLREPESREHIEDELADVFYFVLRFAQMYGVDLGSALERKTVKNALKYPVSVSRGVNRKR
jgi:NTP pyrophosphatase (non-canonical NTP hydrolase)